MDDLVTRWDAAVQDAMASAESQPMAWGRDDCALWAAGIIQSATGRHPRPQLVGAYDSRRSAVAARRLYGRTLTEAWAAVAAMAGYRPVAAVAVNGPALAVVATSAGLTTAVSFRGWWVARLPDGWAAVDAAAVRLAWDVSPCPN